jgi:transketolase
MRNATIQAVIELAEKDKNVFLLTADLGFSVLEDFQKKFPKRFFNVGVAEQNMMGIAAGLALSGKTVFVYSIIPFVTIRCLEQVRNDICYHNLKVRIIGIGSGLSYAHDGYTHYATEDVAVMRSLPNMTIVCPADPLEAKALIKSSEFYNGPIYIRLSKGRDVSIHAKLNSFKIGKGIVLSKGTDATIVASGNILAQAKEVCEHLKNKFSVGLISLPTLKPLDEKLLLQCARKTKALFTIEEHSEIGGLASAVADILSRNNTGVFFKPFALPDAFIKTIADQKELLDRHSLSARALTKRILIVLEKLGKK